MEYEIENSDEGAEAQDAEGRFWVAGDNWEIKRLGSNQLQQATCLAQAEAVRGVIKKKHPEARVTVRPLTGAAMRELYRLNGWGEYKAPECLPGQSDASEQVAPRPELPQPVRPAKKLTATALFLCVTSADCASMRRAGTPCCGACRR